MDLGPEEIERRSFPLKRKGFDRSDVSRYLHRVAMAMAELENAARAAELRNVELRRDVHDLHGSSENGFHHAVASSAMARESGTGPAESAAHLSAEEAQRVLAAAIAQAVRLKERAVIIVEDALSTTEQIESNQARLLAAAKTNRDLLLTEAHEEAADIVSEAKTEAAATRAGAQRFAEQLRELTAAETIELVSYAKTMAAAILETAGSQNLSIEPEEKVTIDLREPVPEPVDDIGDVGWSPRSQRPSRYEARSAKLPRMGDEKAASAIEEVESLRDKPQ